MKISKTIFYILIFVNLSSIAFAQDSTVIALKETQKQIEEIRRKEGDLMERLEALKLQNLRTDLQQYGLPALAAGDEPVEHSAMTLLYNEKHEQPSWVAHIILPDIAAGMVGRTNDFRPDSLVKTGSAVEQDYFLKNKMADGSFEYDGFGYDRGHLAPSADFRWSLKALSESYLYSNMSPQLPDFNRDSWAKLEDLLRAYVQEHKTPLYVITGPILRDELPVVERGVNQVTIPRYYYKLAWDRANGKCIAFIMPNKKCEFPLESYSVSIDSVEAITGFNYFPTLSDDLEKINDVKPWQSVREQDDVAPLKATDLPRNHFNTVQAKIYSGRNEKIKVCGTVVSTKLSAKGNVFLNLDKSFPNQIFTVSIFKDRMVNFSYLPSEYLKGKTICVEGKVSDFNGTPTMSIENEKAIRFYDEEEPE
ncbi:MAG: DNA/RNA non-specific endonuclease [Bacteroidia bacterium]